MPGDCAWLEARAWAADFVADVDARYAAERAAYAQRLRDRQEAVRRTDEAIQAVRRYEATQAVEDAVSVLGADAVVDLVNTLRLEIFDKVPGQIP